MEAVIKRLDVRPPPAFLGHKAIKVNTQKNLASIVALISVLLIINLSILFYGVNAINKHSKSKHLRFQALLIVSFVIETILSVFSLMNLITSVSRIVLFFYDYYFVKVQLCKNLVIPTQPASSHDLTPDQTEQ